MEVTERCKQNVMSVMKPVLISWKHALSVEHPLVSIVWLAERMLRNYSGHDTFLFMLALCVQHVN
jgi:hypothetical protein